MTRDELRRYDEMIKEGLGKGQSLYAIYLANRKCFNCSVKTPCNYLNDGRFARSKRGDQPRACMISSRKRKAKEHMVDRHCRENRRFEDFVNLLMTDEEAIGRVSEMDTLEGRKGGKVIVTFVNVQTMMMFGILCDHKDAWSVNDAVATIRAAFLDLQYPMMFGILLGDRGGGCPPEVANQTQEPGFAWRSYAPGLAFRRRNRRPWRRTAESSMRTRHFGGRFATPDAT